MGEHNFKVKGTDITKKTRRRQISSCLLLRREKPSVSTWAPPTLVWVCFNMGRWKTLVSPKLGWNTSVRTRPLLLRRSLLWSDQDEGDCRGILGNPCQGCSCN